MDRIAQSLGDAGGAAPDLRALKERGHLARDRQRWEALDRGSKYEQMALDGEEQNRILRRGFASAPPCFTVSRGAALE